MIYKKYNKASKESVHFDFWATRKCIVSIFGVLLLCIEWKSASFHVCDLTQ